MKSIALKLASLACVCTPASAAKDEHPIGKIIELLDELAAKAEAEGKSEALAFQKFGYWCRETTKELNTAITGEKESIDSLSSKIDAKTKEKKGLEEQISKLEQELADDNIRGKEADAARSKDNELYEEADADYENTIGAVQEATEALQDAKADTSFLQAQKVLSAALPLLSARASDEEFSKLTEFVQTDPSEVMAAGDAGAHEKAYSFKSMGIVELLKKLQEKFEDERLAGQKAETNAVNNYNLAKQAREAKVTAAEKSKSQKTDLLAEVTGDLADAKSELENTQQDLEADSGSHEETTKSCEVKKSEWDERTEIRNGEIEAMEVAKKILAKVGGVRTDAPSNPVPPASPLDAAASFLQIDDPKMKVVALIRKEALVMKSKALQRLAQEIQTHLNGHFDEVNNMIQKMIFRLMAEQKDEDEHKHWCDLEVNKTALSIENKEEKVEDLTSKIDDLIAKVGQLTEEISEAEDTVSKIEMFMQQAREIREVGKEENKVAIKDSKDAQDAVANAIAVLTDFYKETGEIAKEPYEFIQSKAPVDLPENPETWDSSYTGVADPKSQPGGIVTILEACASDFSQMEADTQAQEATDEKDFQDAIQEHDIEKSRRAKETEMKTSEKKRLVSKQTELEKQRTHVNDELDQTVQYEKDLQPACVEGDSSYEDRKAARTNEIDALHESQVVLEEVFRNQPVEELVQKAKKFLPVRLH